MFLRAPNQPRPELVLDLVRTAEGWKISRTRVKFGRKGDLAPDERANKLAFPISAG